MTGRALRTATLLAAAMILVFQMLIRRKRHIEIGRFIEE